VCSTEQCECDRLADTASSAIKNQTDSIVNLLLDRVDNVRSPAIVGRAPTMTATQQRYQIQVCFQHTLSIKAFFLLVV
jgi:hypothetical protein